MNYKLFNQIKKDSEIATMTVRNIKDCDISVFSDGGNTKFVKWNWFEAIVKDLCTNYKEK